MKIKNNNERFGAEVPFEAESFESLADEMTANFEVWAEEGHGTVETIRSIFLAGLEAVEERHLMNPLTGSVDTAENWKADYDASDPAEWNPEDHGAAWDAKLVEVRKDEHGEWVEV